MSAGIVVRPMRGDDGPRVLAIFDQGIAAGDATFERTAPTWADWDRSHLGPCRLVAEDARGAVAGWAAL